MAISLSTISAIAARKGNQFLEEQINLAARVLDEKAIETEECEGQVRIINVQAGGLSSVAFISGGGTLPTASSKEATQLLVKPVSQVAHVSIPVDAAELVSGKADSVKLVRNQFELAGRNLGQGLGRAIYDGYLSDVEATKAISAGTATDVAVADISGFRVGMAVDIYEDDGATKVGTGVVTARTRDGDGTGKVTLGSLVDASAATLTGNITGGHGLWLQGFVGNPMTSLKDAVGTGNLYGTAVTASDWSGNRTSAGAQLSLEAMRGVDVDIMDRCGEFPTHILMHPGAFEDYEEAHTSNVRYAAGDSLDAFGKNALKPMFGARPVVVDPNCPAKSVYFVNKDKVKLGQWKKFSPLSNGKGEAEVSQTVYSYLIKVYGMHNLIVEQRNALGELHTLTID